MQCLHHGHAIILASGIGARRNEREGIVKMRQVGTSFADYIGKFPVGPLRPCPVACESQAVAQRGVVDIVVETLERDHLDSILLE